MQTKEYRTIDKSDWLRGDWDEEPDKKQWQDAATGLPCLAVRGPGGHWCGYVGVAEGHPLHGKQYSACVWPDLHEDHEGGDDGWHYSCTPEARLRVHGGITYSAACSPSDDESHGICHLPDPGEPDHIWWFGFDCAHHGDYAPTYDRDRHGGCTGIYRDLAYVERECADLAQQLVEAQP